MKKIKIYIEDNDYKNGFVNFLNYYPELKASIDLVGSLDSMQRVKDHTIISDSNKLSNELKKNNSIYYLSSNAVSSKNEIYKYSNVKKILERFIENSNMIESSAYHVYTINSPTENSGKSLLAKTLAEILAKQGQAAFINMLDCSNQNGVSLSELILMSLKNKDAEEYLELTDDAYYTIPGFRLVRDYVEMDIKNLKTLLDYLNRNLNIDFFIIELPASLDKSAEKIIEMSKINFIVNDKRRSNQNNRLQYLEEIGEKAWDKIIINNFASYPKNSNDLPIIRTTLDEDDNREFLEKDYLLFKHKLGQCLGGDYA